MSIPRSHTINLDNTVFYHCISRCVQGGFLCGFDAKSQMDYSHRKQWIVDRMLFLTSCFMIEICAYAVLSNHYHLVLRVNLELAKKLSNDEVIAHWVRLYPNTAKYAELKVLLSSNDELSKQKASEIIEQWRCKLVSISYFMQALNQKISYLSNKEAGKKGHFWEGRFTSQALLDDVALLSCMAYVDLNPIRAGLCDSLEESDFTSIQQRIKYVSDKAKKPQPKGLVPLGLDCKNDKGIAINCSLLDYFDLVDKTGRIIRADKRGHIKIQTEHVLDRLDITPEKWVKLSRQFEATFAQFAGDTNTLYSIAKKYGRRCCKGVRA